MPCHTFLFNINLTTNSISFIDKYTIIGVGNRLLNAIAYVPIFLNLGRYQTKLQRSIFLIIWCTIDQQPWPWPFNIWVLECVGAKAYCRGCHRHLVNVVVSLIGKPLLLLLCYNCHIIFLLLLIFTNNNSCHSFCYDTIFSTGTIIILMPPSQHYNTTEFTYSHPPLIQHQHFHIHRHSHAPILYDTRPRPSI